MALNKITLTRPRFANMLIQIEGVTPYLPGKIPDYALDQIEAARRGEGLKVKRTISPEEERDSKLHLVDPEQGIKDGNYGIPIASFYNATKQAANKDYWPGGIDGKRWGIAVQMIGKVLPLKFKEKKKRSDTVIQVRVPKLDYRWEFVGWSVEVPVRFNTALVTQDTVLAVFDMAGTLGIGKWRPSCPKGGTYGTFKVISATPLKEEMADNVAESSEVK